MELRHLRYFLAVADEGTTTRAAARLRVAQQALSAQLADVERELGVMLFVRHPRGRALTKAGEEFAAHARAVLAQYARAVEHVRRLGADRQVLRVGVVEYGMGQHVHARALAAFRAGYPHVTVEVDPGPFWHHPALLAGGRLDVGYYSGPVPPGPSARPERGRGTTADVAAEVLLPDPLAGVLTDAAHAAALPAAPAPADLAGRPWLGIPLATLHPALVDDVCARVRAGGYHAPVVEVDRQALVNALVAAGAGWTYVPASLDGHAPPGTTYRPLTTDGLTAYDLHVLSRAGAAEGASGADPLAAAFLACLREARDALAPGTRGA